jgi:hypothetical protein
MSSQSIKKRYPKYDKHGNVRPFQDRPFVDELNERENKEEILMCLWRIESEQLKHVKKTLEINIILKVFLVLVILNIISEIIIVLFI